MSIRRKSRFSAALSLQYRIPYTLVPDTVILGVQTRKQKTPTPPQTMSQPRKRQHRRRKPFRYSSIEICFMFRTNSHVCYLNGFLLYASYVVSSRSTYQVSCMSLLRTGRDRDGTSTAYSSNVRHSCMVWY